ncbi:MAG TPA: aromatic ring-hydroxylating dioxygenase subunit alpha [Burkholderiales bacterium]|nr:aromatic ring-hydroxylating dioxygenase subunit alpha [Burkholderiales bacterium]
MIAASQFSAVRKALAEAQTLPPACYHSDEFYALELENIFRRKWILMGRSDEWKEPGAFTAYERFGVPFFITRDDSGRLRAFSNSCRHRASQIVSGSGRQPAFACPYHSWVYGLDGSLKRAPGMEDNPCFDRAQYGLAEIRLEIWRSFVFVNFSSDAGPLAAQLGDLDRHLASYDFDNVVTVGRDEYVVETNWKALVENSMEWLHHPTVHRESIAGKVATIQRNVIEGNPGEYAIIQSVANGVSRATMGSDTGFPAVSTLQGAAREGSHYALLYPFAMIGCDVDSIWYKQMIPEGPRKVRNIATYCFHKEITARDDYDRIAPNYFRRFRKVVTEDNAAMERQLAGLLSPFARPGRFSDREVLVHRIDNWVLDQIFSASA